MTDQHHDDQWLELPADAVKDLDLPRDEAGNVKGGAFDAFVKIDVAGGISMRLIDKSSMPMQKVTDPTWKF